MLRTTQRTPSVISASDLSRARRRLAEIITELGFGTIRGLRVSDGDPVLTSTTEIIRQIKFQGSDFHRLQPLEETVGHEAFQRLWTYFDHADSLPSLTLEVKHGLPFLGESTETFPG